MSKKPREFIQGSFAHDRNVQQLRSDYAFCVTTDPSETTSAWNSLTQNQMLDYINYLPGILHLSLVSAVSKENKTKAGRAR